MKEERCPHTSGERVCVRGRIPPSCDDCSAFTTGLTVAELIEAAGQDRQESLGELKRVTESPLKGPGFSV